MRWIVVMCGLAVLAASAAAGVTIVEDGVPRAAIYADAAAMAEKAVKVTTGPEQEAEKARQRLRESVKDLAGVLERISGAALPIHTGAPPRSSKTIPILVGAPAVKRFGKPQKHSPFDQGWRIVVSTKGVGLMGESDEATSYAIYELLDRLGCRWYMPGELGEVLPSMKTITLEEMDISDVPATVHRNIWVWGVPYRRRNRLGGIYFEGAHALEWYLTRKENVHLLEKNLDWNAELSGKRSVNGRICYASAGAAKAIADIMLKRLAETQRTSISIAPVDTTYFCECAKCKALDAGDWDAAFGTVSITDRYVHFCNEIVKHVLEKRPGTLFGTCAYEQYTRAPVREKPDPSLLFSIAPILYCRAHSMLDPKCPTRQYLREIVDGWAKATDMLIYRDYGYHLAEVSAPFPMITKWSEELPIYYKAGCAMWRPETMATFEATLPGLALGVRMCCYPNRKPAEILDELFTRFYGNAEKPMREYWTVFDRAWNDCPEHAGAIFSYAERFTPAVMKAGREAVDAALKACKTDMERRRVTLVNESLTEFELYMKMSTDLLEGRLADLKSDLDRWLEKWDALVKKYKGHHVFTFYAPKYAKRYLGATYEEASRIAKESTILTPKPLLKWRYMIDKDKKGDGEGWFKADFDDREWKTRDVSVDTWSDFGLWTYYGTVWNRTTVKLPQIPKGKKVFLWISRTDGGAKLYVNGQLVRYVDKTGVNPYLKKDEVVDEFINYVIPGTFDITSAVKPGADNQITIVGRRIRLFELGTGGLVGPVYIYRER